MSIPDSRVVDLAFHDHPFKHVAVDRVWWTSQGMKDASWWSFLDEQHVRDAWWDIQPGDVVFDVGSAYGSYVLPALACGASYVYAWSPQGHPGDPYQEKDFLLESLALNDWGRQVTIFQHGVYSKVGWVHTESQEFYSIEPKADPAIIAVTTIDAMAEAGNFSEAARSFANHFWMKLDVEGAEVEVLRGAAGVIRRYRPKLLVENLLFKDPWIGDAVRKLVESGDLGVKYCHVGTMPYGSLSHSFYLPEGA
jgi:FkbM family methyltransferase